MSKLDPSPPPAGTESKTVQRGERTLLRSIGRWANLHCIEWAKYRIRRFIFEGFFKYNLRGGVQRNPLSGRGKKSSPSPFPFLLDAFLLLHHLRGRLRKLHSSNFRGRPSVRHNLPPPSSSHNPTPLPSHDGGPPPLFIPTLRGGGSARFWCLPFLPPLAPLHCACLKGALRRGEIEMPVCLVCCTRKRGGGFAILRSSSAQLFMLEALCRRGPENASLLCTYPRPFIVFPPLRGLFGM